MQPQSLISFSGLFSVPCWPEVYTKSLEIHEWSSRNLLYLFSTANKLINFAFIECFYLCPSATECREL